MRIFQTTLNILLIMTLVLSLIVVNLLMLTILYNFSQTVDYGYAYYDSSVNEYLVGGTYRLQVSYNTSKYDPPVIEGDDGKTVLEKGHYLWIEDAALHITEKPLSWRISQSPSAGERWMAG